MKCFDDVGRRLRRPNSSVNSYVELNIQFSCFSNQQTKRVGRFTPLLHFGKMLTLRDINVRNEGDLRVDWTHIRWAYIWEVGSFPTKPDVLDSPIMGADFMGYGRYDHSWPSDDGVIFTNISNKPGDAGSRTRGRDCGGVVFPLMMCCLTQENSLVFPGTTFARRIEVQS